LVESIEWAEQNFKFSHFMSIDYDTLFIAKEADTSMLGFVSHPNVGLVGKYTLNNPHWSNVYKKEATKFAKVFGKVPDNYKVGEGVQGGGMLLTRTCIERMKLKRMFEPPFRNAKKHTKIADDHLLPLFVRMCGLDIMSSRGVARCEWTASQNPMGLEKRGVKLFHPTKLKPYADGTSAELDVRNYFRDLRGQKALRSCD
jgi:hypothetical protein